MAMNEPCTRVVCAHGDGNVALLREQDNVSPWRILKVEVCEALIRVEQGLVLGQDYNIMAVPMNWMGN